MQEIDNVLSAGNIDEALAMAQIGLEEVKGKGDTSLECTYYLTSANIVTQKVSFSVIIMLCYIF